MLMMIIMPKEYDNMIVAGTAAALAYKTNRNVHTVDINSLRTRLKENGAV